MSDPRSLGDEPLSGPWMTRGARGFAPQGPARIPLFIVVRSLLSVAQWPDVTRSTVPGALSAGASIGLDVPVPTVWCFVARSGEQEQFEYRTIACIDSKYTSGARTGVQELFRRRRCSVASRGTATAHSTSGSCQPGPHVVISRRESECVHAWRLM